MGSIICFGEVVLRLAAPGHELLMQSGRLDVCVGGAEANVAVGLACLDHASAMIGVVPDNALGRGAVSALQAHGVDCSRMIRREGRMGLYFLNPGAGGRASEVIYDREASAFAKAGADLFDWPALLTGAVRLHVSGITPALGPRTAQAALAAVTTARSLGVAVSFDCNFRPSIWEHSGADPVEVLTPLIANADLVFGNYRDFNLLLGQDLQGDTPAQRRVAAQAAFAAFPHLTHIASTSRTVESTDRHRLMARLDTPDHGYETNEVALTAIVDRIGAGDAFAAGILHGLHSGLDPMSVVHAGLALACLKHTLPGDSALFRQSDLQAFLIGRSDVRR